MNKEEKPISRIFLMRHGKTDWNLQERIQGSTNTQLNEMGIRQAQELGEELRAENLSIDRLYTSKLDRAKRTAEILGEAYGLVPEVLPGVEELCFGDFEGHTWDEIRKDQAEAYAAWSLDKCNNPFPGEGGESYRKVYNRAAAAICAAAAANGPGNLAIVSHGAVLMSLLYILSGRSFADIEQHRLPNLYILELEYSGELKLKKESDATMAFVPN